MGLLDAEQLARATDIKARKGNSVKATNGRMLSQNELNKLLHTCTRDRRRDLGLRDAAIIAVAYALGLRRAEIVALDGTNVALGDKGAYAVTITGKGNKTRVAYLTGSFATLMRDWLALRGAESGALFPRWQVGGYPMLDTWMTTQAIYELFQARATQARIAPFSPHDLRRSCISHHRAAGTDIAVVAAIVGHASVQTTARYDRRGERAKQEAANNLHVTYEPMKQQ